MGYLILAPPPESAPALPVYQSHLNYSSKPGAAIGGREGSEGHDWIFLKYRSYDVIMSSKNVGLNVTSPYQQCWVCPNVNLNSETTWVVYIQFTYNGPGIYYVDVVYYGCSIYWTLNYCVCIVLYTYFHISFGIPPFSRDIDNCCNKKIRALFKRRHLIIF